MHNATTENMVNTIFPILSGVVLSGWTKGECPLVHYEYAGQLLGAYFY